MEQLKRNQTLGKSTEKEPLMENSGKAKPRIPACVYIFNFFAAFGGFEMGYNFSVVSGAMILVREELRLSTFWQVLIVSVAIGNFW